MKKVKRAFKKMPKKFVAFTMLFIIAVASIASITKVIATSYGTGDEFITFGYDNELEFAVGTITINGDTWTNGDEFRTNDNVYTIIINDVTPVENTESEGKVPTVRWGGNWNEEYNNQPRVSLDVEENNGKYTFTVTVNNAEHLNDQTNEQERHVHLMIQENNGQGNQGGGGNEPHFNGEAYVLWSCGTGTCYHHFTDIPNFDDGNSTFYKDTTIKDENNENIHFDVHADLKAWALPDRFNFWVETYKQQNNIGENEEIDWTQVDPEDIIAEYPPDMRQYEEAAHAAYENDPSTGCAPIDYNQVMSEDERIEAENTHQACIDQYYIADGNLPFIRLQPVGEPSDNNAYVSYGDRNFKVVIYNSDFKGITTGNLSGLNYYPARWTNPFLRTDQYDISATTKNKPTGLDSILLETTVNIEALPYNDFEITSIVPQDVPADAVTVNKVGDTWKVEFSSHFYDNVVFKVNNEFYIQIKRYTIDGHIDNIDNQPVLLADFYYERSKSYTDFIITAKIVHKDGTTRNVTLEPKAGVDDGLGNYTDGYVIDQEYQNPDNPLGLAAGKGLNLSTFKCDLLEGEAGNIQDVYLNAEYTGSTVSNYAGAYSGSGEGTLANIYHPEEGE